MATFNGARFIREQLDSFAAQTRLPDELVVTDDGSTDDTLKIVENFARTAPFGVEVHRNPQRLGFPGNFEKAAGLCCGEIVFLSDQDDVWFPRKIETVLATFAAHPRVQAIVNDVLLADEQLKTFGQTQRGNLQKTTNADKSFVQGSSSAHRKEWQQLAFPLPQGITHDRWLNGLAIELGVLLQLGEVLQLYRRHAGTTTEWFVSDPHGVPRLSHLRSVGLADATHGWKERIRFLELALQRLGERPDLVAAHGWGDSAGRIEREIARTKERIATCAIPRHKRSLRVLSFWLGGGYRQMAGWKSAAKDLLRP